MKKFLKRTLALLAAAVVSIGTLSAAGTVDSNADNIVNGMYRSELTGEWISATLQNQRPIAVMVDNEKVALPHYGLNQADIIYEMMNSTANGRVTRLMAIVKDWGQITQFGNIRSARPTNFMLASAYNAIMVHDGGPYYINSYVAKPYNDNVSGGFARYSNGKARTYTEYVTYSSYRNPTTGQSYAGLASRLASAGISTTYTSYYSGEHTAFAETEFTLDSHPAAVSATCADFPFPHNYSKLRYNASTKTYDYSTYDIAHIDPLDNNAQLTFKNAIVLNCSFAQLDSNGYMVYNILGLNTGFYLTNGKCIPILWYKPTDLSRMIYFDATTNEELVLNPGKTYIAIVPSDKWAELAIY